MADCILRTIYDYFKNKNNYDNVVYVYVVLWCSFNFRSPTYNHSPRHLSHSLDVMKTLVGHIQFVLQL